MKSFLKILFILLAIFQANVSEAKVFLFSEATVLHTFNLEKSSAELQSVILENDIANTCKSESDLVAYKNWSISYNAVAAKGGTSFAEGSFSVFNWKGYPAGGIKPTGPFRLLEGAEYTSARNLANSTNAAMRRANPEMFKGLQIHEINPVKFGGSPTNLSNKIFLTPSQHAQYTNFWNALMRSTK